LRQSDGAENIPDHHADLNNRALRKVTAESARCSS
jgi:hypothetical protein